MPSVFLRGSHSRPVQDSASRGDKTTGNQGVRDGLPTPRERPLLWEEVPRRNPGRGDPLTVRLPSTSPERRRVVTVESRCVTVLPPLVSPVPPLSDTEIDCESRDGAPEHSASRRPRHSPTGDVKDRKGLRCAEGRQQRSTRRCRSPPLSVYTGRHPVHEIRKGRKSRCRRP